MSDNDYRAGQDFARGAVGETAKIAVGVGVGLGLAGAAAAIFSIDWKTLDQRQRLEYKVLPEHFRLLREQLELLEGGVPSERSNLETYELYQQLDSHYPGDLTRDPRNTGVLRFALLVERCRMAGDLSVEAHESTILPAGCVPPNVLDFPFTPFSVLRIHRGLDYPMWSWSGFEKFRQMLAPDKPTWFQKWAGMGG